MSRLSTYFDNSLITLGRDLPARVAWQLCAYRTYNPIANSVVPPHPHALKLHIYIIAIRTLYLKHEQSS